MFHADLNPNNVVVRQNNYAVIDFDDCGIGFYGSDLAVALFAFEFLTEGNPQKNFFALKEALFQGYADHMPLTQDDVDMSPYFLLAQKLGAIGSLELRK